MLALYLIFLEKTSVIPRSLEDPHVTEAANIAHSLLLAIHFMVWHDLEVVCDFLSVSQLSDECEYLIFSTGICHRRRFSVPYDVTVSGNGKANDLLSLALLPFKLSIP
jgi:hypothetical protein